MKNKEAASSWAANLIGPATIFAFLIFIWGPLWEIYSRLAPASLWMEIHSIEISDTKANSSPVMKVEREKKQPFFTEWVAELEVKKPNGKFAVVCTSFGKSSYGLEEEFPDPLTLDWWTWPVKCSQFLVSGNTYIVETRWTIHPNDYPSKTIVKLSNEFKILD